MAMAAEAMTDKPQETDDAAEPQQQRSTSAAAATSMAVSIADPIKVIVSSSSAAENSPEPAEATAALPTESQTTDEENTTVQPPCGGGTPVAAAEPPLVNLMEGFVESRLDVALAKFNCCTCEKCRKDVCAIALNKLPALYVIEDDPDIRDLRERERSAEVATALVQAILIVKANPTH